jgi:hypothetical protein
MVQENPASTLVYGYEHVHACMCIIEEIVAPNLAGEPWKPYRDQWGIEGLRDCVIDKLAGACDEAWRRADERYSVAYDAWVARGRLPEDKPDDPGSFDYGFVPFWLRECVDWSGDHPRIKGTTT